LKSRRVAWIEAAIAGLADCAFFGLLLALSGRAEVGSRAVVSRVQADGR
jgi:hypothetical protein